MRSAPQSRFAVAISRINAAVSAVTVGWPFLLVLDFHAHPRRYRSRCQRKSVAGCTSIRASLQLRVSWAAITIHQRSTAMSIGRWT
jgi:hypothetical protein